MMAVQRRPAVGGFGEVRRRALNPGGRALGAGL
jgi:hypothetical protein